MREYRKVSKGVILAIVIAVIVIGVSLISLFSGKRRARKWWKTTCR